MIFPVDFIPQLEKSGNIDELTFLMLDKSATACRLFQDKGHTFTFSVNLSLVSLEDTALADKIAKIVRRAGIEPQSILLEITESAAMTEAAYALENLGRLCMNGFSLSIDDYGTGFSSLQQLTRIAFSELKIDQSFVKDFADNNLSRVVIESTIDMARKLQVNSVAEGVETQQEWDTLKALGCDMAQGFFIAKPMDIREFYNYVVNYTKKSTDISPAKFSGISPTTFTNQSKLKILVVDDDDFSRKLILNVLNFLGYTNIVDTDSAQSALNLLFSNTFDLIVTDVYMPQLNGFEFIQLIRAGKTRAKSDTRIILLTSFSKPEILKAGLPLDINGFLVKPITPADMDVKITKAMSEQLQLKPAAAYADIKIEFQGNIEAANKSLEKQVEVSVTPKKDKVPGKIKIKDATYLPVQRIGPGMILREDITLSDGTLLLSNGHVFTELSLRRLNELRGFLEQNSIAVQELPNPAIET